jgi:hypothetical protein
VLCLLVPIALAMALIPSASAARPLRAGAAAVDISPRVLPAIRNGGFLEATADKLDDPLYARALVLSDGQTTLALAIIDSCMIPRELCDAIKERAARGCGIPPERMLVAATHTHSAPSVMDYTLGCRQDRAYVESFVPRVAEALVLAHARLELARAGWAVVDAPKHTHCRRWLRRAGDFAPDPFGEPTVRAMMHPGYQNPAYVGPAGPVDPALTVLSVQAADGRPLAVLANYSMHYFGGGSGFSADYFGEFTGHLAAKLSRGDAGPPFVGLMSQGTSGDAQWMDYGAAERKGYDRSQYARELGELALGAIERIEHRDSIDLAMAETRLSIGRRLPSQQRLAWAEAINAQRNERRPKDLPEVYAEQAVWLAEHPEAELVLQAVRIGELGLTAIPNEVFGITGLKLKAASPLVPTMNLELANGAEGYIPPPEQHLLGGYTTWPARTAGLQPETEPRIVEALLGLLEKVSGKPRRPLADDFYTPEQRAAIEQARHDGNNRENRGVNASSAAR